MEKVYLILMYWKCMDGEDSAYKAVQDAILGCAKTRESAEDYIREVRENYKINSKADSFTESENDNAIFLSEYIDSKIVSVVSWTIFETPVVK